MSSGRLRGFASAFDDMLEQNRRELDALSGGSSLRPPSRGREGPRPSAPRSESSMAAAPSRTPAERTLDEKLGPGWRHEVVERLREGGELVVRCRINVPQRGITRTVYGSAPLSGSAPRVSGTAGGNSFSLGGGTHAVGGGAVEAERMAERRAVESALAACARLL